MAEREPYTIQHVEQCTICKNNLSDEAEQLRKQGMSFDEIADALSQKHNIEISIAAVKRHFRFVSRVRFQETLGDDFELDEKYGIDKFEQMDLKQRMAYLNLLTGKALARLTAFFYEISDPKRFFNMVKNDNLYAMAKVYGEISRTNADTTKFLAESEKMNEDELLNKLVELASEIGLADSPYLPANSKKDGGEVDESGIVKDESNR